MSDRRLVLLLLSALLLNVASIAIANLSRAADFRIETKVFVGEETTPLSQNTTLFQNGVIYDFLESPPRVAVFHHGHATQPGQFLLIDPVLRVKTEITTDRLDQTITKLSQWATQQKDPLLQFAAQPQFEQTFDPQSGELTLTGSQMTYRVTTEPVPTPAVWQDLQNYLDWYAKLNCLLSSSLPPLPRLEVNRALAQHNVAPVEVHLTLEGNEPTSLRAEHLFTWRLSKDDRDRVALVGEQIVGFREVSNEDFRQRMTTAAREAASPKR